MLTLALYGLLAILLIGAIYLAAAWLLPAGEQIAPPARDEPIWSLPAERALAAADVADVRLPVALRGYRFAETDLLLDRLVEELRARDEEIAGLRRPVTASKWAPAASTSIDKPASVDTPTSPDKPASLDKAASTPTAGSAAEPGADAVTAAAAKSKAEAAARLRPTPANDTAPAAAPTSDGADDVEPAAEPKAAPARRLPPRPWVQPGRHDD